jgi:hypothetical protein
MATPQRLLILRTSPPFYWLVGGILGAAVTLGIFVVTFKTSAGWPPTFILACLLIAILSVFVSTKLVLAVDSIHYRSLFVTTNIPVADIVAAKFVVGFGGLKPYQRLVITVSDSGRKRDIAINAGLFDRAAIRQWVDTLNVRVS